MEMGEMDSSSSSTLDLPNSFMTPQTSQSWRSQACSELSSSLHRKTHAQKIRKRRKPVLIKYLPSQKVTDYNHHAPVNMHKHPIPKQDSGEEQVLHVTAKFQKREITTIHEEVIHFSEISDRKKLHFDRLYNDRFSKRKGRQEKVASLKFIVSRLHKLCVEKPQMLQDNIPDETIRLFKSIHI